MANLFGTSSGINSTMLGTFGTGKIQPFGANTTWTIPPGITSVRVRVWGAGGSWGNAFGSYNGGCGGGFAIKTITGLTPSSTVAVTVGLGGSTTNTGGGSSSFGSYVSATGGGATTGAQGIGSSGDINTKGGDTNSNPNGYLYGGGGVGNLFGNGGNGGTSGGGSGASGGGAGQPTSYGAYAGGNGFTGVPGYGTSSTTTSWSPIPPNPGAFLSIDFIGTGPGGGAVYSTGGTSGANGGGGAGYRDGGFPGGGGGVYGWGANGLVIVEY